MKFSIFEYYSLSKVNGNNFKKYFDEHKISNLIHFLTFLFLFFLKIGFKSITFRFFESFPQKTASAKTLLVSVSGHPSDSKLKTDIISALEKQGYSIGVSKVSKIYYISDCFEMLVKLAHLHKELSLISILNVEQSQKSQIENKIFELRKNIETKLSEFKTDNGRAERFTGRAFVTFKSRLECKVAQLTLNRSLFSLFWRKKEFSGQEAQNPEDFCWENFELKNKYFSIPACFFFIVFIMKLSLSLLKVYRVLSKQMYFSNYSFLHSILISFFSTSFIINIFNWAIFESISYLVQKLKLVSYDKTAGLTIVLTTLATLLNTFISIICGTNILHKKEKNNIDLNEFSITSFLISFYISRYIGVLFNHFVDPLNLTRYFKFKRVERKVLTEKTDNYVLQCQLNELFEKEQFRIIDEYSSVFLTVGCTLFFHSFFPISLFLGIADLCLRLVVLKVLITRGVARPQEFGSLFTKFLISASDVFFWMYAFGFLGLKVLLGVKIQWFDFFDLLLITIFAFFEHFSCFNSPVGCADCERGDEESDFENRAEMEFGFKSPFEKISSFEETPEIKREENEYLDFVCLLSKLILKRHGFGKGVDNIYKIDILAPFIFFESEERRSSANAFLCDELSEINYYRQSKRLSDSYSPDYFKDSNPANPRTVSDLNNINRGSEIKSSVSNQEKVEED